MSLNFTKCGIPGIDAVPYGLHLCHFYPSRQELLDCLIPYFRAGLQNNERCLWIASTPLPVADIKEEAAKYSDLEHGLTTGQLSILDAAEWYGFSREFRVDDIVSRWIEEEKSALANGHRGLRISSNTSLLPPNDWSRLIEYEKRLHASLHGRRIIACCSYDRMRCDAVGILEVVHAHDAALDRTDKTWQVFTPRAIPQAAMSQGAALERGSVPSAIEPRLST